MNSANTNDKKIAKDINLAKIRTKTQGTFSSFYDLLLVSLAWKNPQPMTRIYEHTQCRAAHTSFVCIFINANASVCLDYLVASTLERQIHGLPSYEENVAFVASLKFCETNFLKRY